MKKICFVTTVYGTFRSFLKEFSKYLYFSGDYEIYLICDASSVIDGDMPEFVHYIPIKMERGVTLSLFSAIKDIQSILEKENFDIVQYSTPNAAFYTSIAAKRAKVPVKLYCQWGIRYMGFEGWKRALFKKLEKITCDNSTFIEAESHNIRNFAIDEGLYSKEKSCVIWNGSASGVDLTKFDASKKDEWKQKIRNEYIFDENDVVFSFAARLTADKGINELLEAFLNLSEKYENIRLFVMGAVDNNKSLNSVLFEKAKSGNKVFFTDRVSNVEEYYAASDVFVSPSYREGFGLVVIEAQAMGIPAIVSDVPGQVDAILPNETGLLCKVKDAKSLEEQMETFINNKEKREEMGRNAKKYIEDNFEQKKLFEYLKENRDKLIGESNA
jgi:glycosyltransferase involved in cell wall biosynthesis